MPKWIGKHKNWMIPVCVVVMLFVIGTVTLFSTGILIFYGRNTGISLPNIEMITRIEMGRRYDWRSYSGGVVIEDEYKIAKIMSALYEARKPFIVSFAYQSRSANETPSNRTHLSISFDGSPLFVYIRGDSGYVYAPYIGVYRISRSTVESLIQLYENHEPEWRTE